MIREPEMISVMFFLLLASKTSSSLQRKNISSFNILSSEENKKSELSRTVPKIIMQLMSNNQVFILDAEEQIYTICKRKRLH